MLQVKIFARVQGSIWIPLVRCQRFKEEVLATFATQGKRLLLKDLDECADLLSQAEYMRNSSQHAHGGKSCSACGLAVAADSVVNAGSFTEGLTGDVP